MIGEESPRLAPLINRVITLIGVVLPFVGLVTAIGLFWGRGVTWVELGLLAGMYAASGFGVTVGYHRLFAHRSFEACAALKSVLGVLGSMSIEGPILKWVAIHRKHHQHSDSADDPHSPNRHGGGVRGVIAGFWHAHMGWMFMAEPSELDRYVPDLRADRLLRWVSHLFPAWAAMGLAIPTLIGGWVSGTWTGALLGFIWGGLARVFLVHHATWSINSVCHLWGRRPFRSRDESRNNLVFGVLGLGEGWHNNHHAFPGSARHGLRWWELDLSYWLIRVLKLCRLAWDVKVPTPEAMAARRAAPA